MCTICHVVQIFGATPLSLEIMPELPANSVLTDMMYPMQELDWNNQFAEDRIFTRDGVAYLKAYHPVSLVGL